MNAAGRGAAPAVTFRGEPNPRAYPGTPTVDSRESPLSLIRGRGRRLEVGVE